MTVKQKFSVKDILSMTEKDIDAMGFKELKKVTNILESAARKRVKRLQKQGLESSALYQLGDKPLSTAAYKNEKQFNELYLEYTRIRRFLSNETSTLPGAKEEMKTMGRGHYEIMHGPLGAENEFSITASRAAEEFEDVYHYEFAESPTEQAIRAVLENEEVIPTSSANQYMDGLGFDTEMKNKMWHAFNKFQEIHATQVKYQAVSTAAITVLDRNRDMSEDELVDLLETLGSTGEFTPQGATHDTRSYNPSPRFQDLVDEHRRYKNPFE